jgi:hypothetical protein
LRLRLLLVLCVVSLSALLGGIAAGSSSAAVCSDCALSPFDGLRADIATNAPSPRLARLFTAEANLAQLFHPPSPCVPGSCVASQIVLIALDVQIQALPGCPGGCVFPGCPGGCSFTATNAYVLDSDVRGILANPEIYPLNLQLTPPGPPNTPPGPPTIPGPQ